MFKDWRLLDQSPINLSLDKSYWYYLHSRAWALKGWLGGTHSWITFWSEHHAKWLVMELSDKETLDVQMANVMWISDRVDYFTRTPVISDRDPRARWFGSKPVIVGKQKNTRSYHDFVEICKSYSTPKFNIVYNNCNTFISYALSKLNSKLPRPLRSIGFRNNKHWENNE